MTATKCNIVINIGEGITLHSDKELDAFLWKHRASFENLKDIDADKTFSISLDDASESVAKVEESFKSTFKDITTNTDEVKKAIDAGKADAIGVTTMHRYVGAVNKWSDPMSSYSETANPLYKKLIASGKTIAETKQIMDTRSKRRTAYGDDVHKLMQNAFGNPKDGEILDPLPDDKGTEGMKIIHLSGSTFKSQTYAMCKDVAKKIKDRHPRAKAIYTEKEVFSKQVDGEYLKIVNAIANVKAKNGQFTHIKGIFDLIVIDEKGIVHIYDYKTTSKEFGNSWNDSNWNEDKRHGYEAQLMAYKAMLEQYGVKVGSVNIVSILGEEDAEVDPDKLSFKSFKFDTIVEIPMGGVYDVDAKMKFKTQAPVDTEVIVTLNNLFNSVYPGVSDKMKTALRERTVEELEDSDFVKKVKPGTTLDKKGVKWLIKTEKILGIPDIECYSDEDKDSKLAKYVDDLNRARKNEMLSFGAELSKYCQTSDVDKFEDWIKSVSGANKLYNIRTFKKYVSQGWTLLENPDLLANGILIFQLGARSEIIMLGVENMDHVIKLEKGSTVLGTRVSDSEFGADSSYVLNSSIGHLLEMKAMMFVAQNPKLFESCPVSTIKAVSLHHPQAVSDLGGTLSENYRRLWNRYQNDAIKVPYLQSGLIMDDPTACIKRAEDIIMTAGITLRNPKLFNDLSDQYTIDNIEEIHDLIKGLERTDERLRNFNTLSPNDPMFMAYAELLKAYQSVIAPEDAGVTHETAKGELFNGTWNPDGTFMTSFAVSSSENLRRFSRVMNLFSRKINLEFEEKYARPWQHLMKKVREELESKGMSTTMGGEWRFFKDWFELDENGKPTSEFRIKSPSDSFWNDKPAQKEACEFFLKCINEGRAGENKAKHYYEVPLIRGDFWEQIANVGTMKAVKEQLHNFWDPIREGFMGADDSAADEERLGSNDTLSLWNPMLGWDVIQRSEQISKNTVDHYSTNLDTIFLVTTAWNTKVNACKKFLPALQGFRVLLRLENQNNKANMDEIESAMVKYIGRILYNQNVMDPSYATAYGLLATMKGIVSKVALGFKAASLVREGVTTSITIAVNKAVGAGHGALLHDFNEASYLSALEEMGQMTTQSYNILSKVQQMNAMFGIADFGFSKMAESSKSNRYAPLNVDDSIAYWTSSASDFFHRNAMLVMKLKSIGAWEAYLEDENGDVYYDWRKDTRFALLAKYENYSEVPYKDKQAWREAKELYDSSLAEWQSLGDDFSSWTELKHGLTPSDLGNLKTQCDVLFGNYDEETKSVMMHTFLGSLFMQFKIYGYARLLRYIKSPGAVNVIINSPKKEINKEGKLEEVCMVVNESGTDAEIKFKSQVTDEEWESGRVRVIREKNGVYMEGNFQTMFKAFAAIATMDQAAFKRILENPVAKYNLLMILWDSLFAMLFSALLGVLYGEDTIEGMSEEDWFTRWSYGIASGIAKDGPIWEVARGVYSDGTLPMLSSLKRYANTASSVLAGNTNILSALTNTFGATRELSNFFDE